MKKKLNYLNLIINNIIVQIISTTLFALGTGIITFLVSRKFMFTNLELCLLILVVVIIVIVVSCFLFRRMNRKRPDYDSVDCNFHMIREERVHKWVGENDYIHIRRYKLRSLKNGLTEYVDKFQWTGKDYTLKKGKGDYSIVKDSTPMNVFTVYRFIFKTPLDKGETIELEARWDAKGPAEPFFSTDIQEPTDELIMKVELYPESGIRQVCCRVDRNIGAIGHPIETKIIDLNSEGKAEWIKENPKILHHYEINWKIE